MTFNEKHLLLTKTEIRNRIEVISYELRKNPTLDDNFIKISEKLDYYFSLYEKVVIDENEISK